VPREEWSDAMLDALRQAFPAPVVERFLATGPDATPVPTAISTMLRHPALAGPWLAYNNVLLWAPELDPRARELMVLRVAWRARSTYEWVQHVKLAERYGVTHDDVVAVASGNPAPSWSPLERDLVAATDQLVDDHRIDDPTWARLAEQLDERELIELVFVVGTYACLAMVFNSLALQLEPGIDLGDIPVLPE
jgi:alkylhydroperoxidase family enzyme